MEWKIVPVLAGEFGMVRDDIKFADGNPRIANMVPSYIYLIECGDDQYVVDTSFGDPVECRERLQLTMKREEALSTLILRAGIRAAQVKGLILTHLHWDHAANCMLFPNARIYCQKEEISDLSDMASEENYFLREFAASKSRLVQADEDYEICSGIVLKKCGGHTLGSQSVEVITEDGLAVITGDTIMTYENLRRKIPIGYCKDMDRCKAMLDYIYSIKPHYVLPSHDYGTLNYKEESKRLFLWDC